MQSHHVTFRAYPSGGWGHLWLGDPDRGTGVRQPGGWVYEVLPFIEQNFLYSLGAGGDTATKLAAANQLVQDPLGILNCPTRRRPSLYRYLEVNPPWNGSLIPMVAKSDYAVNAGDNDPGTGRTPISLEEGDQPDFPWANFLAANGICYYHTTVSIDDIRDGTSNTYCIGEKYCATGGYDKGDDESMYVGYDYDQTRWTMPDSPPQRDATADGKTLFGSAHPAGCNFVFCDGSVHLIRYDAAH